jgi:hypothetical protein
MVGISPYPSSFSVMRSPTQASLSGFGIQWAFDRISSRNDWRSRRQRERYPGTLNRIIVFCAFARHRRASVRMTPAGLTDGVKLGRIRVDRARELIRAMKGVSSTVLELAATVYSLARKRLLIGKWNSSAARASRGKRDVWMKRSACSTDWACLSFDARLPRHDPWRPQNDPRVSRLRG